MFAPGSVATMVLSESESEDESVLRAVPKTSVLCEDSGRFKLEEIIHRISNVVYIYHY